MPLVNNITTRDEFKRRLGRTGLSSAFKKKDTVINEILQYLHDAEVWRDRPTEQAVSALCKVRKECITWLAQNQNNRRAARPKIRDLCDAVHTRLTVVINQIYATPKRSGRQLWKTLLYHHDVIDESGQLRKSGRVGRKLDPHYRLERATKTHFYGGVTSQAEPKWQKQVNTGMTRLDFDAWVNHVLIPQSEDDPLGLYFTASEQRLQGYLLMQAKEDHVKYCDEDERKDYMLSMFAGLLFDVSNDTYHTGSKETAFSGLGWAIYVIDHENNWYSESHIVGQFHHSSFLSGAPVQAAGEIAVDKGQLIAITNKTGHYTATPAELTRALFLLHRGGVDLAKVKVNDPFKAKYKWFDGLTAIRSRCELDGLDDSLKVAPPIKIQP